MKRANQLLLNHYRPLFSSVYSTSLQKNCYSPQQSGKDFNTNIMHSKYSRDALNIYIVLQGERSKHILLQKQLRDLQLLKKESSYPCSYNEDPLYLLKLINDLKKLKDQQLSDYKLRTKGLSDPKIALLIITTPELKNILMSGYRKHLFFSLMVRTSTEAAKLALTDKKLRATLLENPNAAEVLYKMGKRKKLRKVILPLILDDDNLTRIILNNKKGEEAGISKLAELKAIGDSMDKQEFTLLRRVRH